MVRTHGLARSPRPFTCGYEVFGGEEFWSVLEVNAMEGSRYGMF